MKELCMRFLVILFNYKLMLIAICVYFFLERWKKKQDNPLFGSSKGQISDHIYFIKLKIMCFKNQFLYTLVIIFSTL